MTGEDHRDFKARLRSLITRHIATTGQHLSIVSGGPCPRSSYTIGLSEGTGVELIFAGGIRYMADDLKEILNLCCSCVREQGPAATRIVHPVLGHFRLCPVDPSWSTRLALGVYDYYRDRSDIAFLQVLPDEEHRTLDIPDMSVRWGSEAALTWRWLGDAEPWPYPIPRGATAVTDMSALQGAGLCEIMRWEEDGWECFSGPPGFPEEEIRVVPLSVLGIDPGLEALANLKVGQGLFREKATDQWMPWGAGSH